jgi:hypothetical protein
MSSAGHSGDIAQLCDHLAIVRLIHAWSFLRDAGEWEELANTFHADGRISVSWFHGAFQDFVATLRARGGRTFAKHVMGGSRTVLRNNRALAESDAHLFTRSVIDGVEFAGHTLMRFLDRVERRDGTTWRILDRVAVYDHDMLIPAVPGESVEIPLTEIERLDPSYRFLAWRLQRANLPVPDTLPTRGSSMERDVLKANAAWLDAG